MSCDQGDAGASTVQNWAVDLQCGTKVEGNSHPFIKGTLSNILALHNTVFSCIFFSSAGRRSSQVIQGNNASFSRMTGKFPPGSSSPKREIFGTWYVHCSIGTAEVVTAGSSALQNILYHDTFLHSL
jgi:hypothetical protein